MTSILSENGIMAIDSKLTKQRDVRVDSDVMVNVNPMIKSQTSAQCEIYPRQKC